MAKKKTLNKVPLEIGKEYIIPDEITKELAEALTPPSVVEVVERAAPNLAIQSPTISTPAIPDKMVRVINHGAPFVCDLTMYGYGGRWPTNAVYTIPASKFVELLSQGLKGGNV